MVLEIGDGAGDIVESDEVEDKETEGMADTGMVTTEVVELRSPLILILILVLILTSTGGSLLFSFHSACNRANTTRRAWWR